MSRAAALRPAGTGSGRWAEIAWLGLPPVVAALAIGSMSQPRNAVAVAVGLAAALALLRTLARHVGGTGLWLLLMVGSILLGELAAVSAGGQSGRILVVDVVLFAGLGVAAVRSRGWLEIPRAGFLTMLVPLLAWYGLGLLTAGDPITGLAELKEWVVAALVGAAATGWAREPRRARILLAGIVAMAAATAVAMLAVVATHPAGPIIAVMMKLVDLPWGRSNYLAGFLIVGLPLALGFTVRARTMPERLAAGLALALCTLGLVLSASKGAMLALAVTAPFALMSAGRVARRASVLGLLVVLAVFLTFVNGPLRQVLDYRMGAAALDFSMSERFDLYRLAWETFLAHPLLGVGLNNFSVVAHGLNGIDTVPHNLELGFLAELGAPGLVLVGAWIGALVMVVRRARAAARAPADRVFVAGVVAAWLACLAHNQVESTVYGAQFKIVLMVMAAATAGLGAREPAPRASRSDAPPPRGMESATALG